MILAFCEYRHRYFCHSHVRNAADRLQSGIKISRTAEKNTRHKYKLTGMSEHVRSARKVALFRVTSASSRGYLPCGYFIKGIPDLLPRPIRIREEKSATYTEKVPMPLWETGPACAFNVTSLYRCTRKRFAGDSDAALVDHIWPTYASLMMIKSYIV